MYVKFAKWMLLSYTVKFKSHSSWASEAFEKGWGVPRVGKFGTTNIYGTKMIKI